MWIGLKRKEFLFFDWEVVEFWRKRKFLSYEESIVIWGIENKINLLCLWVFRGRSWMRLGSI